VADELSYLGKVSASQANVAEFLGIPFAKPPVGDLRWQAPEPLTVIAGNYDSQQFKPACYQHAYNTDWYEQVASLFGTSDFTMEMPQVSEDCLYLNIWKPIDADQGSLPVMVWIHGGSNKAGWAYEPNYLGQELANIGNVIVVSIAYRLGVFGFLAHPDFAEQSAQTNFGILDQIAALKWIQNNIGFFGGDKENVTIFGESAGAANIGYLMSTPAAKGLFRQAISQSGGFQMMANSDLNNGQTLGKQLSSFFNNSDASQLRKISATDIWNASLSIAPDYDYRALQDGALFKEALPQAFSKHANVNLLIGSNKNEYYMYLSDDIQTPDLALLPSDTQLTEQLNEQFARFESTKLAQDWLDTFLYMSCPSALMAELVSRNGKQAYMYRFDRVRENGQSIKAYHGAEIPYVFNTHDDFLPTNEADRTLTQAMMTKWVNFARYGDPNGSSDNVSLLSQKALQGLNWPQYSQQSHLLLRFDASIESSPIEAHALCQKLWPEYLKQ
jgi:para-nitrobenzyl esterase